MRRVNRSFWWAVEHAGAGYFLALAAVAVAGVAVAIVVALATGSWWMLLAALCFPLFWLYISGS